MGARNIAQWHMHLPGKLQGPQLDAQYQKTKVRHL